MHAPSILKQNGDKGGSNGRRRGPARSGGSNQGKVTGVTRRYMAHPRKRGQ